MTTELHAAIEDASNTRTARRWPFRFAAILLGLAPFLLFESWCVVADWGCPALHDDPFVGFRGTRPLFVPSADGTRYEIPKARQEFFRPAWFNARKSPREFRVFCLGDSTVQGNPYAVETSFTTWLELALQAADPSCAWKVVNCGGVSYASYRLAPIVTEVLDHEADLIVLYTGHNEFLEARTFDHVAHRPAVLNTALGTAAHLRTFNLMREGYLRLHGKSSSAPAELRPMLPVEVDALLDYRGGLEQYHHDDAWRKNVVHQYAFNLRRMIALAGNARVPVIVCNPVSNFSDAPPFKSEHGPSLSPADRDRWNACCDAARSYLHGERRNLALAIQMFEQARRIDPLHAGTHYNLGKCYEAVGQWKQAHAAYLAAKDTDVCPLRILQSMNDLVVEIARETSTPLIDAQALFESLSPHGIVGGQWLVDHVHPNIEGHKLLADKLAEQMIALGIVAPRSGWQEAKHQRYAEHYASLDARYFVVGAERLNGLRGWAAGRATRQRTPDAKDRTPTTHPGP